MIYNSLTISPRLGAKVRAYVALFENKYRTVSYGTVFNNKRWHQKERGLLPGFESQVPLNYKTPRRNCRTEMNKVAV